METTSNITLTCSNGYTITPQPSLSIQPTDSMQHITTNQLQLTNNNITDTSLQVYVHTEETYLLHTLLIESNAKFVEVYIRMNHDKDDRYITTCRGNKLPSHELYSCNTSGKWRFNTLVLKFLSLKGSKSCLTLNTLAFDVTKYEGSPQVPSNPSLSSASASAQTGAQETTSDGLGFNMGMDTASSFMMYRTILLNDMRKLLDEKLRPIDQRLSRLESSVNEIRQQQQQRKAVNDHVQEEVNPSRVDMASNEEVDDMDAENYEIVSGSPVDGSTEEESLKKDMSALISLLRATKTEDQELQTPSTNSSG